MYIYIYINIYTYDVSPIKNSDFPFQNHVLGCESFAPTELVGNPGNSVDKPWRPIQLMVDVFMKTPQIGQFRFR